MTKLTFREPTFLSSALDSYAKEVVSFMNVIRDTATAAGFPAEDYIPQAIQDEYERVGACIRILRNAATDTVARLAGVEVRDEYAGVFHAALLLKGTDLNRRLRAIRSAPLAPAEARRPLEDRIARIDREVRDLWRDFPVSEALELIASRVALREGGLGWQSLVQWLREQPKPMERWWCFCDTTFFLESRQLFSQVDWHTVWGLPRVVLVAPQAMLRELDEFKADPRKERSRRRQRATKVLQVLESTAEAAASGTPARLRSGVEVLVLDHEASPDSPTLDLRLADDRLIAAALDFWEHLPDEHVILVSDDRRPRFKARRYGLERRDLPADQRRLMAEREGVKQ